MMSEISRFQWYQVLPQRLKNNVTSFRTGPQSGIFVEHTTPSDASSARLDGILNLIYQHLDFLSGANSLIVEGG